MRRRSFLLSSFIPAFWANAKESSLPIPEDLRTLSNRSLTTKEPIVLLASLLGCPYCEMVRRSYLLPYKAEMGLQSWQLNTTDHGVLIDFAGKKTSPAAYLKALRIKVTPTVVFLNERGEEIAPRIEGASIPDFYGAYLDARLAVARKALR